MIPADDLVVDELAVAVGVFHKRSRIAVRASAGDAGGIGQLRAGFTHHLCEAIDALLGGDESADDAHPSGVGDQRIHRAVEADDAASFGRHDGLVVGIATCRIEPEITVMIHLGEHLGNLAACILKSGTVELNQQAVRHARAVGVAKNGDFARVHVVVGLQQRDEVADEGDIGCFGGFAIDIPTVEVAIRCHADGGADMRIEHINGVSARPTIAMK